MQNNQSVCNLLACYTKIIIKFKVAIMRTKLLCCLVLLTASCSMHKVTSLPDYAPTESTVLHKAAKRFTFPLTADDIRDIDILEAKYDAEENCAGLAGPQISLEKAIIIFAVKDDPDLKKVRKDLVDTMPKTIWLNPSYEPVSQDMVEDWEGCFSVPDVAGLVKRYKKIRYTAFDKNGKKITGTATGFLARVIQHETDHINGILFTSKATKTMPLNEYRAMRKKAMAEGK
jgi:peptide deformylase